MIASVIGATAMRLGVTLKSLGSRALKEDEEVIKWFNTYRIAESTPQFSDLPAGIEEGELCRILESSGFHSVIHELLAARLTDAPEVDVQDIQKVFELTLGYANPAVDLSGLAEALFDYYDTEICSIVGRIQGASPEFLPRLRSDAFAARMVSSLKALERRLHSYEAADPERDREFLRGYRNHVLEEFGKIEPPDFERRRRVPIDDLYVTPEIAEIDTPSSSEIDVWELGRRIDRTVLLGDPGGGKTTASNVLMHWHANSDSRPIPFLVTLRDFASQDPPERSVLGHIEHTLEVFYQCPPPKGLISRLLLSGSALIIFDGLDELIDTARRAEVTTIVERFCTEYPMVKVLVTSRLVGYDQARLDDQYFVRYRVGGFDAGRVGEYVRKWFAQEEGISRQEAQALSAAFMGESASVSDLRANPLMLALMCILYRGEGSIPRNRPEVYEQCAGLLFRKWDARRRIHTELRARPHVEPALRHLAHWLFSRQETEAAVTHGSLIRETANFLHGRGFESIDEAKEAAEEFVDFCKGRAWVFSDAGTTARGEALYTFTHRTFLEYFTAAFLSSVSDTPEKLAKLLAPHVAKEEWEVVAELAVQMKDRSVDQGAARIYRSLLNDRRYTAVDSRNNLLAFLAACLESVDPPPGVVRELCRNCLSHLFRGGMNEQQFYAPLLVLIRCSGPYREIVASEITAKIDELIESGDAAERMAGLRIAIWCDPQNSTYSRGPLGAIGPEVKHYWRDFTEANCLRFEPDLVAAAETDSGFLRLALDRRLVDLEQVLSNPNGFEKLTAEGHPTGIFGTIWSPYLPSNAIKLVTEPEGVAEATLEDMAVVGKYICEQPSPPWIRRDNTHWAGFVHPGVDHPVLQPLSSDAFLGASVLMMIVVELSGDVGFRDAAPQDLGYLSALYPYLLRRDNPEMDLSLPPLPIPQGLQRTMERWAVGEVNFLQQRDA
ncbi:NACHT domain-containing NTPase [Streptomyces sp. NBC_00038]|uniref:NACHT domain-containing protein n=1 Tax=Streptomyces sp. NBC_00038 TaxID=2903615 RepID=UPI0022577B9A|nr:NACHT domain-containing protein [Streptomyces sp. NBC_00038]MCX5560735.1 NACHT domain-containing protein [Streptomyces sp. NBC_00038]